MIENVCNIQQEVANQALWPSATKSHHSDSVHNQNVELPQHLGILKSNLVYQKVYNEQCLNNAQEEVTMDIHYSSPLLVNPHSFSGLNASLQLQSPQENPVLESDLPHLNLNLEALQKIEQSSVDDDQAKNLDQKRKALQDEMDEAIEKSISMHEVFQQLVKDSFREIKYAQWCVMLAKMVDGNAEYSGSRYDDSLNDFHQKLFNDGLFQKLIDLDIEIKLNIEANDIHAYNEIDSETLFALMNIFFFSIENIYKFINEKGNLSLGDIEKIIYLARCCYQDCCSKLCAIAESYAVKLLKSDDYKSCHYTQEEMVLYLKQHEESAKNIKPKKDADFELIDAEILSILNHCITIDQGACYDVFDFLLIIKKCLNEISKLNQSIEGNVANSIDDQVVQELKALHHQLFSQMQAVCDAVAPQSNEGICNKVYAEKINSNIKKYLESLNFYGQMLKSKIVDYWIVQAKVKDPFPQDVKSMIDQYASTPHLSMLSQ